MSGDHLSHVGLCGRFLKTRLGLISGLILVGGPLVLSTAELKLSPPYLVSTSAITYLLIAILSLLLFGCVNVRQHAEHSALAFGVGEAFTLFSIERLLATSETVWRLGLITGVAFLLLCFLLLFRHKKLPLPNDEIIVVAFSPESIDLPAASDPAASAWHHLCDLSEHPKAILTSDARMDDYLAAIKLLVDNLDPAQKALLSKLAQQKSKAFLRYLRKHNSITPDE